MPDQERELPDEVVKDAKDITNHKDRFVEGVTTNFASGITLADFNAYIKAAGDDGQKLLGFLEEKRRFGDDIDFILQNHGWRFQALVDDGTIRLES